MVDSVVPAAPATPTHRNVRLPLKLTIRSVTQDARSVHVDALVTDADGVSVRFMPIDMNSKTTPAEVIAILQATVTDMAVQMNKRKEAVLDQKPATEQDFKSLVGQVLQGSVAS
jgi:hypothetical protein